jgi:hypothetical protein
MNCEDLMKIEKYIKELTGENSPSGNSEGAIIYANKLLA